MDFIKKRLQKWRRVWIAADLAIFRQYLHLKGQLPFRSKWIHSLALSLVAVISITLVIVSCHIDTTPRRKADKVYNIRGKIITLAESLIGIPYQYGGSDIEGFDCSGFVQYVFDSFGITIPRTARDQSKTGNKIRLSRAKSGDIAIFKDGRTWHSGILKMEEGILHFIHSPNRNANIRKERMSRYWQERLIVVIRVL